MSKIIIANTIAEIRSAVTAAYQRGDTVGLVPTMGALHDGHASLMDLAANECSFVVATIFVNPTQFGPNEDFARYPRTWDDDLKVLEECGVDAVFAPTPEEIYPPRFQTFTEVTEIQKVFEGAVRPGHFRGVATVVLKLFNIIQSDRAYFGQKDAQQVRVIEQMVRDLAIPVKLRIGPTVREPDGLALSSRNRYLDVDLRRQAVVLSGALFAVQDAVKQGETHGAVLRGLLKRTIAQSPAAVLDYAEIVERESFQPVDELVGPALAIVAAKFGTTRLIDNAPLERPGGKP